MSISQTKVYMDGTIRYGYGSISTLEESKDLFDTLHDTDGKHTAVRFLGRILKLNTSPCQMQQLKPCGFRHC